MSTAGGNLNVLKHTKASSKTDTRPDGTVTVTKMKETVEYAVPGNMESSQNKPDNSQTANKGQLALLK